MGQITQLTAVLEGQIVHPGEEDSCSWRWSSNGQFSVKTMYTFLNLSGIILEGYSSVWNTAAPLKNQALLWKVALGKIVVTLQFPVLLGPDPLENSGLSAPVLDRVI